MRRPWWILALLGASACDIDDPAEYAEVRAQAVCSRVEHCEQGRFESDYNSEEDCVGEIEDQVKESNQFSKDADCDFVADEATRCVRRIRGMACEDWAEGEIGGACDLVWNCNNAGVFF